MVSASVPRRGVGLSGSARRTPAAAWRHVDLGLAVATIGVACFGLLMIYSATRDKLVAKGIDPAYYLKRQAVFLVLGIVAMMVIASIDYRRLRDFAPVLYGGSIFLLLAIFSPLGHKSKGAQAWFQVAGYQFEPSEVAKVALIMGLAGLCASYKGRLGGRELLVVLGLAAVPFALIYKQPDLGTALILGAILIAVLLVAGLRARHLAVLALIGVVGVVAVLHFGVLQQYQKQRLTAFLDQSANTQASAYNLNQSKIAIGSGGPTGKGLGKGTQTNLSYVPEQQTDFIFTAVGEQLGFVGSGLLLSLFMLMVWRTWRAASSARVLTGTLLCVGVLAMLVFQ
ncbi:MAG: FtsW/RodA/SpoVE family cell cycle protein, partial [Actinomycetota bacterium]|nr:FtsW/RodA/SpoVE family cell cycle protein [Actinomycetota bacterium]